MSTISELSSQRVELAALKSQRICGPDAPPSEYLLVMDRFLRKDKWFPTHGMPRTCRDSAQAALVMDEAGVTRIADGRRVITAEEEMILELGREYIGRRHTSKRVRALVGGIPVSETSRFSQAQLLLAALFSVILTGDSGLDFPPETIVPLLEEFSNVFMGRDATRYCARASGLEMEQVHLLLQADQRPSTVLECLEAQFAETGADFTHGPKTPTHRAAVKLAASTLSLQEPYVRLCWAKRKTIDAMWDCCREALLKVEPDVPLRKRGIRIWHNHNDQIARAIGLNYYDVRDVADGWVADPLVRAALRAVQCATAGPLFRNSMKEDELHSLLEPYRNAAAIRAAELATRNGGAA